MTGSATGTVDFDLHGLVGIRLVDPGERDVRAVARQLGGGPAPLERDPDLVVRFVDRLQLPEPLRYLGRQEAAWAGDTFVVLRGKHKAAVRVGIPFDRIGRGCELTCETGAPAVPLLIPILNLTLLDKGVLPLHAAAFVADGVGVLVTGWSKGGKTEALLAFMARGAEYVGDEWVYLTSDGRMHGIPEPIRLWDWHLRSLPGYAATIAVRDRARLRALRAVAVAADRVDATARLRPLLRDQLHVDVRPRDLFGTAACRGEGRLDRLFLVLSTEDPQVRVQPIDGLQVAARMVASLHYERRELLALYAHFRFAFPDRSSGLVETALEREAALLAATLGGVEACLVTHPYPFSLPALHDAMRPVVERASCSPSR